MSLFNHRYVRVNDGSPSAYSDMEIALAETFVKFHESGGWEWESVTLKKLECDNRDKNDPESHYPNLCWHYLVTINVDDVITT